MTRSFRIKAMTGLFAALFAPALFSMEAPAADAPVEEIEVVGQRTMIALRLQMEAAQDEVHTLFNQLNTDDNFDILCKVTDKYFSKVKEKTCLPVYAWDARADEGQDYLDEMQGIAHAGTVPTDIRIAMQGEVMRDQMIEALRNSPELFDAIVKHAQLMDRLAAAQATYFGDDSREDAE